MEAEEARLLLAGCVASACGKTSWRSSAWSSWCRSIGPFASRRSLICRYVIGFTYEQQNLALGPAPPSHAHWLGTDPLGRDLLARLLYGGQISLMVGFCATVVSLIIGVIYGAISGFVGGKLDMAHDADGRYSLRAAVHDFRHPADGLFRAKYHSALRGHRRRRMADHGPDCARPGHGHQTAGIRRSRPRPGIAPAAAFSSGTFSPICSAPSSSMPR